MPLTREFIQRIRSKLINNNGSSSTIMEEEQQQQQRQLQQRQSTIIQQHATRETTEATAALTTTTEYRLNSHLLPMHRIIVTTSSIGRVAFVRQLVNTELVITYPDDDDDDDDDNSVVTTELVRFGFRTLIYPNNNTANNGYSALGNFLIP